MSVGIRRYIIGRIIQAVPLFFAIITFCFILIHSAPGDPVVYLYGSMDVPAEFLEKLRDQLGLNKPLHEQYLIYLSRLFRGDLGYSQVNREQVIKLIIERMPNTLLLMGSSFAFSMIFGIFLGIIAAKYERSKIDYLITAVSLAGYSAPVFWAGMMVMLIFSVHLGWFPTIGMTSLHTSYTGIKSVLDILHHLVLPSAVLGMWYLATYARLTRTNMLEVLKKDYITTARAKGLNDRAIYYVHAFRNAMLPVITVIGLNIGHIVVGAVITETVFSWPGIGSLLNAAVNMRDYTLLMGLFVITSVSVILTNLVTDCIYAFIDPRIRYR